MRIDVLGAIAQIDPIEQMAASGLSRRGAALPLHVGELLGHPAVAYADDVDTPNVTARAARSPGEAPPGRDAVSRGKDLLGLEGDAVSAKHRSQKARTAAWPLQRSPSGGGAVLSKRQSSVMWDMIASMSPRSKASLNLATAASDAAASSGSILVSIGVPLGICPGTAANTYAPHSEP